MFHSFSLRTRSLISDREGEEAYNQGEEFADIELRGFCQRRKQEIVEDDGLVIFFCDIHTHHSLLVTQRCSQFGETLS